MTTKPSPTEAAIAAAELLGPPPAKRPPRNTRRTSIYTRKP